MKSNCIHHRWIHFIIINPRSLRESLGNESGFISYDLVFLISFSDKYPFVSYGLYIVWGSSNRPKHVSFDEWRELCLDCFLPFWPILPLTTFSYRPRFIIIMHNLMDHWEYRHIIDDYIILIPKIITIIDRDFCIPGIIDLFMGFNHFRGCFLSRGRLLRL